MPTTRWARSYYLSEKMSGSISQRGGNATRLLPKKSFASCWTLSDSVQPISPGRRIGQRRGATRAPAQVPRPECGPSFTPRSRSFSCPLRDWPQGDKPSRHDAATRRTRCLRVTVTIEDPHARPRPRRNATPAAPHSASPKTVQERANPATDRARPGTTGSAKVVPFLTAADTSV